MIKIWTQITSCVTLPQASGARVSLQGFPRPWPEDTHACCPCLAHPHSMTSLSTELVAFPWPAPGGCWTTATVRLAWKPRSYGSPETASRHFLLAPPSSTCSAPPATGLDWQRTGYGPFFKAGLCSHMHVSECHAVAFPCPLRMA